MIFTIIPAETTGEFSFAHDFQGRVGLIMYAGKPLAKKNWVASNDAGDALFTVVIHEERFMQQRITLQTWLTIKAVENSTFNQHLNAILLGLNNLYPEYSYVLNTNKLEICLNLSEMRYAHLQDTWQFLQEHNALQFSDDLIIELETLWYPRINSKHEEAVYSLLHRHINAGRFNDAMPLALREISALPEAEQDACDYLYKVGLELSEIATTQDACYKALDMECSRPCSNYKKYALQRQFEIALARYGNYVEQPLSQDWLYWAREVIKTSLTTEDPTVQFWLTRVIAQLCNEDDPVFAKLQEITDTRNADSYFLVEIINGLVDVIRGNKEISFDLQALTLPATDKAHSVQLKFIPIPELTHGAFNIPPEQRHIQNPNPARKTWSAQDANDIEQYKLELFEIFVDSKMCTGLDFSYTGEVAEADRRLNAISAVLHKFDLPQDTLYVIPGGDGSFTIAVRINLHACREEYIDLLLLELRDQPLIGFSDELVAEIKSLYYRRLPTAEQATILTEVDRLFAAAQYQAIIPYVQNEFKAFTGTRENCAFCAAIYYKIALQLQEITSAHDHAYAAFYAAITEGGGVNCVGIMDKAVHDACKLVFSNLAQPDTTKEEKLKLLKDIVFINLNFSGSDHNQRLALACIGKLCGGDDAIVPLLKCIRSTDDLGVDYFADIIMTLCEIYRNRHPEAKPKPKLLFSTGLNSNPPVTMDVVSETISSSLALT